MQKIRNAFRRRPRRRLRCCRAPAAAAPARAQAGGGGGEGGPCVVAQAPQGGQGVSPRQGGEGWDQGLKKALLIWEPRVVNYISHLEVFIIVGILLLSIITPPPLLIRLSVTAGRDRPWPESLYIIKAYIILASEIGMPG